MTHRKLQTAEIKRRESSSAFNCTALRTIHLRRLQFQDGEESIGQMKNGCHWIADGCRQGGRGIKKSQKFADVLNGWSLTLMTSIEKANSLEHTSWNYSFNDVFGKYLLNSHILEPTTLNMLG